MRQKAAESRIAESERQKRDEEQRRLAESEAATRPKEQNLAAITNGNANATQQQTPASPATPERALSIPGAFDTPEGRPGSSGRGKKAAGNFFNSISKHLGINSGNQAAQQMQNMLTNGQGEGDAPPPYTAQDPNVRSITPGTERVTSPRDLQANLQSAIKATREYNASSLFSPPETKDIKESPSYCDSKPGHDIKFVAELSNGIKLYLSRSHPDPNAFLQTYRESLAQFIMVLSEVANVFELSPQMINIFHDEQGAAIAFNSNGSLFCNLRYFLQLHMSEMSTPESKVEAMAYWWITLCHELAHNLVKQHDAQHSYYTESFVAHYFRRMVWLASRVTA